MSNYKTRMLVGACVTMASLGGYVMMADAGGVTDVYGGGSSLIAVYARQAEDCYGIHTPLINKAVPPQLVTVAPFNYTGATPYDCSTTNQSPKARLNYISTGSGTGINGVFSHDPSLYGDVDPNTAGNQFYPSVQYGFSDTSLDATDVGVYNNGGGGGTTHIGITVQPHGGGAGTYPNPRDNYGPLVQFPISLDPVVVAYDPVYKKVRQADNSIKEYKFAINGARADGSGGLRLDATTYCKIFNGQITNWNDAALKALNNGHTLKDPADPTAVGSWSVAMQIVGRFDSSGTTSIFTRHLANVCAALGGNNYANGTTTTPAALHTATANTDAAGVHGHYDKTQPNNPPPSETLGQFTLADGNDGVAKYLDFTKQPSATVGDTIFQGRVGYAGADWALPGANNNPGDANVAGYALNTAKLKNASGQFIDPTPNSALLSFGTGLPPQSHTNGKYDSASLDPKHRNNPQDWVQSPDKANPLANPTATKGYPIVGTTNFLGYTCYSTTAKLNVVSKFLGWYLGNNTIEDANLGLLAKAGLAPLPKPWQTALKETFTSNSAGLNLNFNVAGTGNCTGFTPGG